MADYNIIYTSPHNESYLWNGSSFDLLKKENEKLMFSGKTYEDKDLPKASKKATEAAKKIFPADKHPKLKHVEVPVTSKDETKGHSKHITS